MQTNFFGMFVLLKQVEFVMEDIRDFLIYIVNWRLKFLLKVHGVEILPFIFKDFTFLMNLIWLKKIGQGMLYKWIKIDLILLWM